MKAFVLGGYGKTGSAAVRLLARSDLITGIAVAGRNEERAEALAVKVGAKATAVRVDGTDEQQLTSTTAGYDILINAANNEVVLPCIRAAIHNHAHYCDMAWAQILEDALELSPAAEAAGTSAVIATGISPCITNLMGVHATRQLESVEQLQIGRAAVIDFATAEELRPRQWLGNPRESLEALIHFRPFLAWMLDTLQKNGSPNILSFQDGRWAEISPIQSNLVVPLAQGGRGTASPYFCGNDGWGSLPRGIARADPVDMWFSPLTPQLDSLLHEQALHILAGETTAESAVSAFYDAVQSNPRHWLTTPESFVPIAKIWVRALGEIEGRPAQHTCWFTAPMWDVGGYFLTSVALVAAVLKILRGEVETKGVLLAEKALEPQSFLDEVAALLPDPLPDGKLFDESLDWLA